MQVRDGKNRRANDFSIDYRALPNKIIARKETGLIQYVKVLSGSVFFAKDAIVKRDETLVFALILKGLTRK